MSVEEKQVGKLQILVADDDNSIRTILSRALTQAGYEVRLASNINTLMNWINQDQGDLVISDVVMPDGNIFDYMDRFKNSRPNLPIIVMSAQNTFMTAIKASEAGAYEYLPKPLRFDKFASNCRTRTQRSKIQWRSGKCRGRCGRCNSTDWPFKRYAGCLSRIGAHDAKRFDPDDQRRIWHGQRASRPRPA